MQQISITFPDKSVRTYNQGVTPQQIADSISEGLGREVVVARINGDLKDLTFPIE